MRFSRKELIGLLEFMIDRSFDEVGVMAFRDQFSSDRAGRLAVRFADREGLVDRDKGRVYLQDDITERQIHSTVSQSIQYEIGWYDD